MTNPLLTMKDQLITLLADALHTIQTHSIPELIIPETITVQRCKDPSHGDLATNIALLLAKPLGKNPRDLAQMIVAALADESLFEKVDIAGPGFINFTLKQGQNNAVINQILQSDQPFGHSNLGKQQPVHFEFVSANPTGPLHVGHGRGAAYGASLANILDAVGYKIYREYYVNDAGRQMRLLALSTWIRYMDLCETPVPMPEGIYMGDYIKDIAKDVYKQWGKLYSVNTPALMKTIHAMLASNQDNDRIIDNYADLVEETISIEHFEAIKQFTLQTILEDIKNDLSEFGVHYDSWFFESALFKENLFEESIQLLKNGGYTYEKDGALWFRATELGDDKDRILIRSNGVPTYFASDVAYHLRSYKKFDALIDIFGADHHGYIARLKAFLTGLGQNPERLKVLLVQFAVLYRGNEKVSMSTRSGEFVTLRELRHEVGNDAARFFYIMRKPDQHLDFDLDLAKSQSNENPIFYIHYAHARICSIFRKLDNTQFDPSIEASAELLALLTSPHEEALINQLADYPATLDRAAKQYAPHGVAHYCTTLAQLLHAYYNAEPILSAPLNIQHARVYLLKATQTILAQAMALLGCQCPEMM
jgi:arginyl-tRNA synthetase